MKVCPLNFVSVLDVASASKPRLCEAGLFRAQLMLPRMIRSDVNQRNEGNFFVFLCWNWVLILTFCASQARCIGKNCEITETVATRVTEVHPSCHLATALKAVTYLYWLYVPCE